MTSEVIEINLISILSLKIYLFLFMDFDCKRHWRSHMVTFLHFVLFIYIIFRNYYLGTYVTLVGLWCLHLRLVNKYRHRQYCRMYVQLLVPYRHQYIIRVEGYDNFDRIKGAYWIIKRFLVHHQILHLSNNAPIKLLFFQLLLSQ